MIEKHNTFVCVVAVLLFFSWHCGHDCTAYFETERKTNKEVKVGEQFLPSIQ